MKITDRDRAIRLIEKPQHEPANKGRRSALRIIAERYNIHPRTLYKRHKTEPDVPLEVLAARPVQSRSVNARNARRKTPWHTDNDILFEG